MTFLLVCTRRTWRTLTIFGSLAQFWDVFNSRFRLLSRKQKQLVVPFAIPKLGR